METQHMVAILPDGREHFMDARLGDRRLDGPVSKQAADSAVRHFRLEAPYGAESDRMVIRTWQVRLKDGQAVRASLCQEEVRLPTAAPNESQFEVAQDEVLEPLPEPFRGPVRMAAWESGHSAGYSEVLLHLREIVGWLLPAVNAYDKIRDTKRKG